MQAYPDRCALRGPGRSWTYTELDRRVRRLAGALHERGVSVRWRTTSAPACAPSAYGPTTPSCSRHR
ncbi:AMP-binding protein [Micromonospora wenchangensis]|uniref:AMP-binding protein n=1 Tax=Micromonospora wenchangensis TaxID=1185415 RepID=UPI003D716943